MTETKHVISGASFVGELYYLALSEGDVKLRIKTKSRGEISGTTTMSVGRSLRGVLFENVKVNGHAKWTRYSDGKWEFEDFIVSDFAPAEHGNLRDEIDRLREIAGEQADD